MGRAQHARARSSACPWPPGTRAPISIAPQSCAQRCPASGPSGKTRPLCHPQTPDQSFGQGRGPSRGQTPLPPRSGPCRAPRWHRWRQARRAGAPPPRAPRCRAPSSARLAPSPPWACGTHPRRSARLWRPRPRLRWSPQSQRDSGSARHRHRAWI